MGRSKEFEENVVLQKAMELFWKQGYEKTSLNDLVEHMGIHRRSLYDTFGDKHTLFLRVIDFYGDLIKSRLTNSVLQAQSEKNAIECVFDFVISGTGNSCGCLFVNTATEVAPRDEAVKEKTEKAFEQEEDFLRELICKGQETGAFSSFYDAQTLAESLHNTLIGLRVLARTNVDKDKLHRIAAVSLAMLEK